MEETILEEASASDMFERTYERTNDLDFHYACITYGVNKSAYINILDSIMRVGCIIECLELKSEGGIKWEMKKVK